ncbi:MAG TPA: hypothetical protein DCX54_07795 [Flavobacteriales bacterium]|nr:hypothetical protein [Flavobacteriales bacterium]
MQEKILKKSGVPTGTMVKLTPERRLKLEEAASLDCSVPEMALWANVSRATVYNWMKQDPELKERLDSLRETPFLKARTTIVDNLDKADTAKWYLERKKKKEFAQRQEHTGADGKDLPTPIIDLNGLRSDNSNKEDSETNEEG